MSRKNAYKKSIMLLGILICLCFISTSTISVQTQDPESLGNIIITSYYNSHKAIINLLKNHFFTQFNWFYLLKQKNSYELRSFSNYKQLQEFLESKGKRIL